MNGTNSDHKDFAEASKRILKKAYLISGKIIIVIDESLVRRLLIDPENTWFEEEEMEGGIFLRIRRIQTDVNPFCQL